jgi:5'-3' exonuclease
MKGIFELDAFNEPIVETENLMIVDCLNLSFRYKHKKQFDFAADYLRTLTSLAKSYGAKHVVLLADKGKSSLRRELYPEYKGNREELYANQTDEEKEEAAAFFEGYEKALELCSTVYPLLRLKGVEADDLAGYIVKSVHLNYKNVWMISSDKDWDLLLKHNVHRFSFVTRKEYTLENFFEEHGCDSPEQYIGVKALQGDPGDNIPGVPGVGIKRAYSLIKEHGTLLELVDKLPLEGKQQFVKNVNAAGESFLLRNLMLVDLSAMASTAIIHPDKENMITVNNFIKTNLEYEEEDLE